MIHALVMKSSLIFDRSIECGVQMSHGRRGSINALITKLVLLHASQFCETKTATHAQKRKLATHAERKALTALSPD